MDERELVWHYCNKRPLHRPTTNVWNMIGLLLLVLCLTFAINIILSLIIKHISGEISFPTDCFYPAIIPLALFYKKFCIMCIELYQHYAPEHIRRRCVCMPTCSEYAILCLKKYSAFKAFYMIYNRLKNNCIGDYHIDNP